MPIIQAFDYLLYFFLYGSRFFSLGRPITPPSEKTAIIPRYIMIFGTSRIPPSDFTGITVINNVIRTYKTPVITENTIGGRYSLSPIFDDTIPPTSEVKTSDINDTVFIIPVGSSKLYATAVEISMSTNATINVTPKEIPSLIIMLITQLFLFTSKLLSRCSFNYIRILTE